MKRNEFKPDLNDEDFFKGSWYSYDKRGFVCGACFDLRWINLTKVKLSDVLISKHGKIVGDE